MAAQTKRRGRPTTKPSSTHSMRCPDEVWAAGRKRAESEGETVNAVLSTLLEGYALGHYKLPQKVYPN